MIIDVHAHAYPAHILRKVAGRMGWVSGNRVEIEGTTDGLVESMERTGVDHSVFLPVATNPKQVGKLNAQAMQFMECYHERGLISFGAVHPDTENVREVLRGIKNAGLRGVKIHPDYQQTYFDDIRYMRILDAASELELFVLTHAGMDEMYPEEVHCDIKHILNVIQSVNSEYLILAHMGGWQRWRDVENYVCGAPVYLDTAFSLTGTVDVENNGVFGAMLDDETFVRLARKHGVGKILFGSDTPWSSQQETVAWVQGCSLSEHEKRYVLGENAARILGIPSVII